MTQIEYFIKIAKNRGQYQKYNFTREFLAIDLGNLKHIDQLFQKDELYYNDRFPIPFINYLDQEQEGRHRTLLSYKYNLKKIPVLIIK